MKNILLFLLLIISCQTFAQSEFNKFYRSTKRNSDAQSVNLPGVVFKLGAAIAKNKVKDDPVASYAVKMAKKIKGIKMLFVDGASPVKRPEINNFLNEMKSDGDFEDMFMFKTAGTDVHFLMRDSEDIIKNLVILFADENDGMVLLNIKSKLKKSEISELINMAIAQTKNEDYEEEDDYYEDVAPEKEKPQVKKEVKKKPRA